MSGPFEQNFELETNDPLHKLIKVSVVGSVKPVPAYVKRIQNAEVQRGGGAGSFIVWPTASPTVPLEPGERIAFSLRLRPASGVQAPDLELASGAPDFCKLRREERGGGYFLDLSPVGPSQSTSYAIPIRVNGEPAQDLKVNLDLKVFAENLVVTPRELDFGEVSLTDLDEGLIKAGHLGVRKQTGSLEIRSISTTLPFLKLERQTIIAGSNYLIRVSVESEKRPKPGSYAGVLLIETTDQKRVEVPVRIIIREK